ncbi:putative DXD-containing glycosyltransferase [Bodo saltans virus]|uniref:DXD-containing glycosyltransferase n=1 Tax=Bodo saltans virus TaxID=2024608 RepID=A0A2H4UTT0_9VIRU|nr:putative DXD-containing glycosyltransferase [Bodo saltans virus]ATZ80257.1 putative DXD-containing glycosyltransferase [Bodo saltans virus]
MQTYIIILIVAICILLIYMYTTKKEKFMNQYANCHEDKPYLFTYWEIKKGHIKRPDYINLCFKTMKKHGGLFNLVILDENTVYDYLPNLRKDINELPLALKVDYIRIMLLYHYGGFWLDADMILLKDLHEVVELLNNNEDFIGFGCTGYKCSNGYGKPSNWAMGAMKGSIMMKNCLEKLNKKLDEYFSKKIDERKELDYHELGKMVIWEVYDELKNDNYKYYHFLSEVDGSRDKNGLWITPETILNEKFDIDEDRLMMLMLANYYFCGKDKRYNWFCGMSENDILNGDSFACRMFRKALN